MARDRRRSTPYRIEIAPEAYQHLVQFGKNQQKLVLDRIPAQLGHQPTVATRNRKRLEPNPMAAWELRVGRYRIYFEGEEADANTTLSEYARKGLKEPLVVTRRGRPVIAVTPVSGDWESVAVADSPEFQALVERSRAALEAGKGIPLDEVRRRLGLERRRRR